MSRRGRGAMIAEERELAIMRMRRRRALANKLRLAERAAIDAAVRAKKARERGGKQG